VRTGTHRTQRTSRNRISAYGLTGIHFNGGRWLGNNMNSCHDDDDDDDDDDEEEEIAIISSLSEEDQKKKKRQRFWKHNKCKKVMIHCECYSLYPDLLEDEAKFFELFRLTYRKFMTLLDMLGPNL
jgi:hypothetical protein